MTEVIQVSIERRTLSLERLTPVQLQQRVIHAEAELEKYRIRVKKYENDYYYGMIDELKQENEALSAQLSKYERLEELVTEMTKERERLRATIVELEEQLENMQAREKVAEVESVEERVEDVQQEAIEDAGQEEKSHEGEAVESTEGVKEQKVEPQLDNETTSTEEVKVEHRVDVNEKEGKKAAEEQLSPTSSAGDFSFLQQRKQEKKPSRKVENIQIPETNDAEVNWFLRNVKDQQKRR
ncbi:hypothetical protein P4637_10390 [Halalkalibacterium halodurans]|uniref:BH2836 protein n=1 Tax=Halalkalibacterium halodurans (strain ATCC BAA-125 / DSM 18197 / FERM 7344 / JCM 9153 / C-125) TaxID=272558 RepID=Q9K915_HALH5|nr:hypothetical protein [Halalkalibacterium halodurans]MDY7223388.1 hypothetical protein [Halalkalibacterium halodurans]MDY7242609.1 hypothetical protein [Halalkalibacterium halodurans]MED3647299.1 hypothetical protein [Halalkalibacterium halodurans]MED4081684.1 hypothetical protein [Halalkalibacterium halodurans]MED4085237.1 hypothetical protein [Halalkalibacterium halodurans]